MALQGGVEIEVEGCGDLVEAREVGALVVVGFVAVDRRSLESDAFSERTSTAPTGAGSGSPSFLYTPSARPAPAPAPAPVAEPEGGDGEPAEDAG